jgi:hypothetical protein
MSDDATPTWGPDRSAADDRSAVRATRSIAAPAEAVWAVMATPGNLELCHPFCERNPVTDWPGVGSRDTIEYLSGWVYERRFTRWIDGVGYDLRIGASGEETSFVTWRVEPAGDRDCVLTISVHPRVVRVAPPGLRWLAAGVYVRPRLRRYLSSVVQGFEWYVTRGKPVPRNQFGRHPWFS